MSFEIVTVQIHQFCDFTCKCVALIFIYCYSHYKLRGDLNIVINLTKWAIRDPVLIE